MCNAQEGTIASNKDTLAALTCTILLFKTGGGAQGVMEELGAGLGEFEAQQSM